MSLTEAACSVNMTVVCKTSKHHLYVPADSLTAIVSPGPPMTVYTRTVLCMSHCRHESLTEAACGVNLTVVCKTSKHNLYATADRRTTDAIATCLVCGRTVHQNCIVHVTLST